MQTVNALSFEPTTQNHSATVTTALDGEEIYQLVKRADINPSEVEEAGAHALEVSVLWDRAILHVAHLDGANDFVLTTVQPVKAPATRTLMSGLGSGTGLIAAGAAMGNYAVGAVGTLMALAGAGAAIALDARNQRASRDTSRFVVGPEVIQDRTAVSVVRNRDGRTTFVFVPGARGDVELNGTKRALEQLVAQGVAKPSAEWAGAFEIDVESDGRYRMQVAGLTIQARVVAKARPIVARTRRDMTAWGIGAGAAAAVAVLIGASLFASSDPGLVSADNPDDRLNEIQQIMALAHDREPTPVDSHTNANGPAQPDTGTRARGTEGAMGRPDVAVRNRRYTIPRNDDRPHLTSVAAQQIVSQRGIFAAMGAPGGEVGGASGIVSPWGELTESGMDREAHNGALDGDLPGDAFGYGGLGRVGTGFGGGGNGLNTVGAGNVNTMGHGNGTTYGDTAGHHFATRGDHIMVRPGPVDTQGTLPAEAIRRVVLRNIGQIEHCQVEGMQQNPNLQGRVVVRFVIGSGGVVLGSGVVESGLQVPATAQCIANAVRRWQFPSPEGNGIVRVNYPFTLQAAQ